jgi:hypothetical protein
MNRNLTRFTEYGHFFPGEFLRQSTPELSINYWTNAPSSLSVEKMVRRNPRLEVMIETRAERDFASKPSPTPSNHALNMAAQRNGDTRAASK